jgi:putative transcriptional regulator
MLKINLKTQRMARGLTQGELAIRLNVVRQTVSKWEKGQSVPDADMLIQIAEIFEVSVSELLGAEIEKDKEISDIAEQLSRVNEQIAVINRRARRIWKTVAIVVGAIVVLSIFIVLFNIADFNSNITPESKLETEPIDELPPPLEVRSLIIRSGDNRLPIGHDGFEFTISSGEEVRLFAIVEPLGIDASITWEVNNSNILEVVSITPDTVEVTLKAIGTGTEQFTVIAGNITETVTVRVIE